jgi:arabinofuranosyltransferase
VRMGNWAQGWQYVRLYFSVYPILYAGFGVAVVGGALAVRRRRSDRLLLVAVLCAVYLLYVLHIGGDFMFARFLLPITPLLYIGLEDVLRGQRRSVVAVGTAVVVATTLLARIAHESTLHRGSLVHDISDERRIYGPDAIDRRRRQGQQIAALFAGIPARFAIWGGQASLAYFAHFPYVVERYGLTDREIARRPVGNRGRPGHEKVVLEADLRARHVNFAFRAETDSTPGALNEIQLGDMRAITVIYDNAVMQRLATRPGVHFVDIPKYLDSRLPVLEMMTPDGRAVLWTVATQSYFPFNSDPVRLAQARAAFQRFGIGVAAERAGSLGAPSDSTRH